QILSLIAAIIFGVSFFIIGYYNVKERYKQKNTSPYSRVL
ncbi:TPA: tryptophan-rich sensory protein, partial [Streptococcus agalactiae]